MDRLEDFVTLVLHEGRVVLRGWPLESSQSPRVIEVLEQAHAIYRLDVAGPPTAFDAAAALEAARLLAEACWALVSREEAAEGIERRLALSIRPHTPAQHLSADLLLRFLPQVYRRLRAMNPADPLTVLLANALRGWPLSGVLAGLDDGPLTTLDFGGHEGLMLLYAERWLRHENPAWRPTGRLLDYAELARRASGGRRLAARAEEGMAVHG